MAFHSNLLVTVTLLQILSLAQAATCDDCHSVEDSSVLLQLPKSPASAIVRDVREPTQATLLLGEVERIAASAPPERNMSYLATVKDMLMKTLMPGLEAARDHAQTQLNEGKNAIDTCNVDTAEREKTLADTWKTVAASEAAHTDCRGEEKVKLDAKTLHCDNLKFFLESLSFPTKPSVNVVSPDITQLGEFNATVWSIADSLNSKFKACKQATEEHSDKVTACDAAQNSFEDSFCDYRKDVVDLEEDSSKCYGDASSSYSTLQGEIEEEVPKWNAEYAAMEKILCYLDVWMSDSNPETVDQAKVSQCVAHTPDASAMNVSEPDIAEPEVIELSPSQQALGAAGFPQRYTDLDTYNPAVRWCIPTTTTTTTKLWSCSTGSCLSCVPQTDRGSETDCASCHSGYNLVGKTCQPWTCTTGSGTGCLACVAQVDRKSATDCVSCNPGYEVEGTACKPIGCLSVGSGNACLTCVPQSERKTVSDCASCNSGYELVGTTCQEITTTTTTIGLHFVSSSMSWSSARTYCQNTYGGDLAEPRNNDLNERVMAAGNGGDFWVGGIYRNGDWEWQDGSKISWRPWRSGSPSVASGGCVRYNWGKLWETKHCHRGYPFMCQSR